MKRRAAVAGKAAIGWPSLTRKARAVFPRSYVPYSRRPSGAAVLADSGRAYAGCRVENHSLGLTIAATCGAVAQAVAAGERQIVAALVVVAGRPAPPRGECLQALSEFGSPAMPISVVGRRGARRVYTLGNLLPTRI